MCVYKNALKSSYSEKVPAKRVPMVFWHVLHGCLTRLSCAYEMEWEKKLGFWSGED